MIVARRSLVLTVVLTGALALAGFSGAGSPGRGHAAEPARSGVPATPARVAAVRMRRQPNGILTGAGTKVGSHLLVALGARGRRGPHGGERDVDATARASTAPDFAGNTSPAPPPEELATAPDLPAPTDDFTLFRTTTVIARSSATGVVAEPTAANDGNLVAATGNDFFRLSQDNGFRAFTTDLDPSVFDDEPVAGAPGDEYCCDQSVIAIDRGDSSLLVWIFATTDDAAGDGDPAGVDSIQVVVFRSAEELADEAAAPRSPDVCRFAFTAGDLGRADRSIDFPQAAATREFLYLTAGIVKVNKDGEPKRIGAESVIWRMSADDLAGCRGSYSFWNDGAAQIIRAVQGAGSTMYFARHRETLPGDTLRIYSIADSSATLRQFDRDITNFPDDRSQHCRIVGETDPCDHFDERIAAGFRSGSTVGWMWTAPQQGNDYP